LKSARTTLADAGTDKAAAQQSENYRPAARRTFIRSLLRPEVGSKIIFPGVAHRRTVLAKSNVTLVGRVPGTRRDDKAYPVFPDDIRIAIVISTAVGVGNVPELAPDVRRVRFCFMRIESPEVVGHVVHFMLTAGRVAAKDVAFAVVYPGRGAAAGVA